MQLNLKKDNMHEVVVRFEFTDNITSLELKTLLVRAIYEKDLEALDILGQIVDGF